MSDVSGYDESIDEAVRRKYDNENYDDFEEELDDSDFINVRDL